MTQIADLRPTAARPTAPTSSTAGRRARSRRTRARETPCCGYEEEDTNWGGSSTLLGEKVGPVRAIRETWGADSGTNVIRRETFYRDEMQPEDLAARARDPAAGRHLRAVGLQRRRA